MSKQRSHSNLQYTTPGTSRVLNKSTLVNSMRQEESSIFGSSKQNLTRPFEDYPINVEFDPLLGNVGCIN